MKKRLTKSKSNIVISGTLAGIAEFFGIDPTIVRVVYVLLSFFTLGSPIIVYILLMLVIPSAPSSHGYRKPYDSPYGQGQKKQRPRKEAERANDDDWSDF